MIEYVNVSDVEIDDLLINYGTVTSNVGMAHQGERYRLIATWTDHGGIEVNRHGEHCVVQREVMA